MRRSDREITDTRELLDVMRRSQVVTLGLWGEEAPYLLPVNFGMEPDGMTLYIHGAATGTKYDLLAHNDRAGFSMIARNDIIVEGDNCTTNYESVCGWGVLREITDETEKRYALRRILEHYDHGTMPVDKMTAANTRILCLQICSRTGKQRKGT